MALAPYDPSSLGPSQAAQVDLTATNDLTTGQQQKNTLDQGRFMNQNQFQNVTMPGLTSSLGATGQIYGTAGQKTQGQAQLQYQNQDFGIQSAFDRAHTDMQRNQVFASTNLIL